MKKELIEKAIRFRNKRNWKQFHTPKNLAISISLEANELLEHFQWVDSEEAVKEHKEDIAEELADVLLYCIYLADVLDLDIPSIIDAKIDKNVRNIPFIKPSVGKKVY